MAHATLTSLPTETLGSIFGHFCLHCCHGGAEGPDWYFRISGHSHQQQEAHERSWYLADYRQPLVSLCLVSRRLRDVAQRVLHHEFVLGYGDSWRSASSSWDRRLTPFLRTVGWRPDLAAAVRRVSLHPRLLEAAELGDAAALVELRRMGRVLGLDIADESAPPCYQDRPNRPPRPPPTPEWIHEEFPWDYPICEYGRQFAPRIGAIDSYTSDESFRERHALGLELLAILVGMLPGVERLSIQQTVVDYDTSYLSGLRSMTTARGTRHLKTLDLATHDYSPELMIKVPSQAVAALELAGDTLQTLNLHMCNGFWSEPEGAPTFRSLRTLRLTQSHLSAAALRVLLSRCTGGLTSFTYEAARSCTGLDGIQFSPPEAAESLGAHSRTLSALHLDLRQVVGIGDQPMQPLPPASLAGFSVLEDVFLSINTLWTKDEVLSPADGDTEGARLLARLLPASTVSLCIAGGDQDRRWRRLPSVLLGLSRAGPDEWALPRLRRVRCDSIWERRLDKALGPDISSIFRGAGVEFGFGSLPLSPTTVASGDVPGELMGGTDAFLLEDFDWEEAELEQAEREEAEREEAEPKAGGVSS